ncbi:MAG: AMP-binding protein [Phycisphaerae bacterium]|nr:AMP-binding protein [Phycisphaerae bacterium]MDW8261056.1 AMP-binding protein [Phycisphaerales bacterium]
MLTRPLLEHAAAKPDALAISDDRGTMTWRQLAGAAAGLSAYLAGRTDREAVGILLPAGGAFVVSFYGILLAGKVAVPINFLLGDREIGHIIADSGIDTVLSAPPLADRLAGTPLNVIDLTQLPPPDERVAGQVLSRAAGAIVPPEQIATLLYTSGTSGLPKGVILTHGNLDSDVRACIEHARLTGEHRFLGIVPLFHSTGLLATMIAPVTLGAPMTFIARFSPVATLKAIREQRISVMGAVPSMYAALLRLKDASAADLQSLYAPISGGEPLPPTVREAFAARFNKQLMEGYGLTETCGPICFNAPHQHKPGSVGRPIAGAQIRIVDENGSPVPQGTVGEIWMRGPMVTRGYHNLPAETAAAFSSDGYFKSGDLGMLDADGYLTITGRKKDVIIVAGEKVYPREVEDLIALHPAVAEVAVVGKKDESRGEVVVAFVVPREGQTVGESDIRDFCRERGLIPWKTPRQVVVTTELPRSPTGKILKRVLAEQLAH